MILVLEDVAVLYGIPPPIGVLPGEPVPETASGVLTGLSFTMSETQANQLLSGLWYIIIHTQLYPDGEIRGQAQVVPILAAVWLFGSGLLGLAVFARRKHRPIRFQTWNYKNPGQRAGVFVSAFITNEII
ncbi:MAG: CHRD domain-containing protein [Pseudomonadota bacterium]